MIRTVSVIAALAVTGALLFHPAVAGEGPALLAPPPDSAARTYLGIPDGDAFHLADIAAEVLVVELFSFFCSTCRAEAPALNRLFEMIEKNQHISGRVRMLGIGIGSALDEVRQFQEKFSVPFPLVSDRRAEMMRYLSATGTPTVVLLKRQPSGVFAEVSRKTGAVGDPAAMFDQVRGTLAMREDKKSEKGEINP